MKGAGYSLAEVMAMTPRLLASHCEFVAKQHKRKMKEGISVIRLATWGKPEDVKKAFED